MKKINKKYGILLWITGLSGSGKTTISKLIFKDFKKNYGPTVLISGDDIRNIFNLKGYDKETRLIIGKKYIKLCKLFINQKINVIFSVAGLFHELRKIARKSIKNYCEIYIKTNIVNLKRKKKKIFYRKKMQNVWGLDIKPELPKNPDIIINNTFKDDVSYLSNELIKKITKILKYEKKK